MSASMMPPPLHHNEVEGGHVTLYAVLDMVHDKISFSVQHPTKPKTHPNRGTQSAEHFAWNDFNAYT